MIQRIFKKWQRITAQKFHCVVCDRQRVRFLPIADFYAQKLRVAGFPYGLETFETLNTVHYACENCGASDRERLIALYLSKVFSTAKSGLRILDIAPSRSLSGFIQKNLKQGYYRTADMFMPEVDDRVDITQMTCYDGESFDVFICSHVLEHIPNDRDALRELHRILKPAGAGILLVPLTPLVTRTDEGYCESDADRLKRFGQEDHVRLYAIHDFVARIKETGFTLSIHDVNSFPKGTFAGNGLTSSSKLYIVTK